MISLEQFSRRIQWSDVDDVQISTLIVQAHAEDLGGWGLISSFRPSIPVDLTTTAISADALGVAKLNARRDLVVCGLPLIPLILRVYDPSLSCTFIPSVADGRFVTAGTCLGELRGPAAILLQAERVILNFIQKLSGIATQAYTYVQALGDSTTRLLDTRKTTPGYRVLEKYAVACGTAWNHRIGLFQQIMLKDNHLAVLGNTDPERLAKAVEFLRQRCPGVVLEVEIDRLDQLDAVLAAGCDVVMLDNFSMDDMKLAVERCKGLVRTEASGNITLKTLPTLGRIGLDFISSGALVHQSVWCDIGMDWLI
jgi:nicotinate-nucleotide pyrophosphorylase (carboxylating)